MCEYVSVTSFANSFSLKFSLGLCHVHFLSRLFMMCQHDKTHKRNSFVVRGLPDLHRSFPIVIHVIPIQIHSEILTVFRYTCLEIQNPAKSFSVT